VTSGGPTTTPPGYGSSHAILELRQHRGSLRAAGLPWSLVSRDAGTIERSYRVREALKAEAAAAATVAGQDLMEPDLSTTTSGGPDASAAGGVQVTEDDFYMGELLHEAAVQTDGWSPEHSWDTELVKGAEANMPDKKVQDLIWLLFDAVLTTGKQDNPHALEGGSDEFEPLTMLMKEVLGDKTCDVVVSGKVLMSPCALTEACVGGPCGPTAPHATRETTMEINPKHPIITELNEKAAEDKPDEAVKDLVLVLYDISLLAAGYPLDEPTQFAGRVHRTIMSWLCKVDVAQGLKERGTWEDSIEAADHTNGEPLEPIFVGVQRRPTSPAEHLALRSAMTAAATNAAAEVLGQGSGPCEAKIQEELEVNEQAETLEELALRELRVAHKASEPSTAPTAPTSESPTALTKAARKAARKRNRKMATSHESALGELSMHELGTKVETSEMTTEAIKESDTDMRNRDEEVEAPDPRDERLATDLAFVMRYAAGAMGEGVSFTEVEAGAREMLTQGLSAQQALAWAAQQGD